MDVVDNKTQNLQKAEKMIREVVSEGAQIVMLPEMFNTPYQNDKFDEYSENDEGITVKLLSTLAAELNILLIGGSISEKEKGKLYNTSYIFDQKGKRIGKYRKMHLFDIDVPGKVRFMESDTLTPGNEVLVLDTVFGKIGIAICFDIRFPEVFRKMALEGAKYVFIPAAFNTTTGPAHWHILTKARALDNQMFLSIASPARSEVLSYKAYGHSLVVSPWGDIQGELSEKEGTLLVDINEEIIEQVRAEIPVLKQRKPEFY